MGLFSSKSKSASVNWLDLKDKSELQKLIVESENKPVLLFKHSTRCSISSMAKNRLESNWDISEDDITPVYLDLIKYRDVSNQIESELNVKHESPQIILLKNGKVNFHTSHNQISVDAIKQNL